MESMLVDRLFKEAHARAVEVQMWCRRLPNPHLSTRAHHKMGEFEGFIHALAFILGDGYHAPQIEKEFEERYGFGSWPRLVTMVPMMEESH